MPRAIGDHWVCVVSGLSWEIVRGVGGRGGEEERGVINLPE